MLVILGLGTLRQDHYQFKGSLVYAMRPRLRRRERRREGERERVGRSKGRGKKEVTSKDQMRLCLPFHSTSLRKAVSGMQGHSPASIGSCFKFLSVCQRLYTTPVCTTQEHTQPNGQPSNPRANGCAWFSDHQAVLKLTFS